MRSQSIHFPHVTPQFLQTENEGRYFDRKSAQIKPINLGPIMSAFANADGGTIAIGIADKTHEIEGINHLSTEKINALQAAPQEACKPMPPHDIEFLDVINHKGEEDRVLLIHIHSAQGTLIRTNKDDTYLRMGDKSCIIKGEALKQLEYNRQLLKFEETQATNAEFSDLDESLIEEYKKNIAATDLTNEQVLNARGFLIKGTPTFGAILLFARNIRQFYPNCRVRFLRYDGQESLSGTKLNLIKDHTIEAPIPTLITASIAFISTQLRDFSALDPKTGKFKTTSEYPEFAWQEGLINAITHREYALSGDYIRVIMYDDRLIIESPGKLPAPVTTKNIKHTRYARNTAISRVLNELGWVKELNEGVKRIYADMEESFLNPPLYSEPQDSPSVKLVLFNNIDVRRKCRIDSISQKIGIENWNTLDDVTKSILTYLSSVKDSSNKDLVNITGYSPNTIMRRLRILLQSGIVRSHGLNTSPNRRYSLNITND